MVLTAIVMETMILSSLLLLGCKPPLQCNGAEQLCDRPLNEVVFAGTHNAMSSSQDHWSFPNQEFAFERQLMDGIRGLNFDTYLWNGEAALCHGFCQLGTTLLVDGLQTIANFLQSHPNEVLVITLQSNLDAELTLSAFEDVGLLNNLVQHSVGNEWSTLEELIDEDQRIVLFTNQGGGEYAGYLDQWEHWIDNPYSAQSIEDFSCDEDRGNSETATLFIVNHFITNPISDIEDSRMANDYDVLSQHVSRCWETTGRFPNQVLVDFYSQGDVIQVVNELNGLE